MHMRSGDTYAQFLLSVCKWQVRGIMYCSCWQFILLSEKCITKALCLQLCGCEQCCKFQLQSYDSFASRQARSRRCRKLKRASLLIWLLPHYGLYCLVDSPKGYTYFLQPSLILWVTLLFFRNKNCSPQLWFIHSKYSTDWNLSRLNKTLGCDFDSSSVGSVGISLLLEWALYHVHCIRAVSAFDMFISFPPVVRDCIRFWFEKIQKGALQPQECMYCVYVYKCTYCSAWWDKHQTPEAAKLLCKQPSSVRWHF